MLCRGWRRAIVLVLALTSARTSAAEPTADERARLPALLRQGEAAAAAKDWKGCVDVLWTALKIEDAARVAGDLGLCEEQAGRFADAANHLHRALAEPTPDMLKKAPWKTYRAALARVREQVAMLVITTDPRDAFVLVDGKPYGRGDGLILAVTHGKHTIVGRAEGYEDEVITRHLDVRSFPNVQLTLKPKVKALTAPAAPASAKPPAREPAAHRSEASPAPQTVFPCFPSRSVSGVLLPVACAGAAVFMVSAVTAFGLEVHLSSLRNALDARGFQPDSCAPGRPLAGSADCKDIDSRLRQRTDAANVMIGSGITAAVLGAAAGIAVAVERKGPKVTATAGATGGGIIVQGEW